MIDPNIIGQTALRIKDTPGSMPGEMKSPKAIYDKLTQFRTPFISRAEESAKFTIPALMPPVSSKGMSSGDNLYQPYQSLGSRGVNALAANLLMTLLPPSQSFFRLIIDPKAKAELGDPTIVSEIERSLGQIEQVVQKELEIEAYRPTVHEALRLLIVTGNALVQITKDGGMRAFRLDNYVVQRNPSGDVRKIVVKEKIHVDTLDPELVKQLRRDPSLDATADLYTCIKYIAKNKNYEVFQTVEDVEVPGSFTKFKPE